MNLSDIQLGWGGPQFIGHQSRKSFPLNMSIRLNMSLKMKGLNGAPKGVLKQLLEDHCLMPTKTQLVFEGDTLPKIGERSSFHIGEKGSGSIENCRDM